VQLWTELLLMLCVCRKAITLRPLLSLRVIELAVLELAGVIDEGISSSSILLAIVTRTALQLYTSESAMSCELESHRAGHFLKEIVHAAS